MNKITVIGSGNVGSTIAYTLTIMGLASEIVMIDLNQEKSLGEALDIRQGVSFCSPASVYAGTYEDAKDSDIVVITSGMARKPGQSRLDLAQTNVDIIKSIADKIVPVAPDATYVIVSNPVDVLTYVFLKHTGLDGVDFEDNNLAVLEYEKALARVYVSSVEVNGWGRRQFVVSGSKGTYNIMPIERKCTVTYSDTSIAKNGYADMKEYIEVPDVPNAIRYDIMMQDFYEYIKGTKENPYTYEHDYLVQKVLYEICGGVACGDWQHKD